MKMRIQTNNVDVVIEGDYQHAIFMKFIEQHPEELKSEITLLEIVELPETPWTPEELLEHLQQGHI